MMKKTQFFIFLALFIVSILYQPNIFAQDSPQWHLPEGATKRLGKGWLYEIQYSPDGTRFAAGGTLGVWIYDTATDKEITLLNGFGWGVSAIAYSPDGKILASGSASGTIRLWDTETDEILQTLDDHWRSVRSLAFSPDGSMLASGSRDRTVRLWNPQTGELLHTLRGHTDGLNSVAFSADGSTVISAVVEMILSEYGMLPLDIH